MGVRQRIRSWLIGPETLPIPELRANSDGSPSPGVIPPERGARPLSTTADEALTLPGVYRAVSIIATGVSQLSLDVWRGEKLLKAPAWVARPDIKMSRSAFFAMTATSMALHGNAFWRIVRDSPADAPGALIALDPMKVYINEETGTFSYLGKEYRDWQIQHLALLRVPGVMRGLGPIQAAQASLAGAIDLDGYAAQWFDAGNVPNGILSTTDVLDPEDAEEYKARWIRSVNGKEPAVLGNGLSYQPLLVDPKTAQFLESRAFTTQEIARLFGVPAHLLLASIDGNSMTYTNVQDADLAFMRWGLTAYLREIEEAITMLLPRGQVTRFNLDALLRPATKGRYEAHQIAIEAGFLTIDEVREIEGLPPMNKKEGATDGEA